jgi:hypothetical protein
MADISIQRVRSVFIVTHHCVGSDFSRVLPHSTIQQSAQIAPYAVLKVVVEDDRGQRFNCDFFLDKGAVSSLGSIQAVSYPKGERECSTH